MPFPGIATGSGGRNGATVPGDTESEGLRPMLGAQPIGRAVLIGVPADAAGAAAEEPARKSTATPGAFGVDGCPPAGVGSKPTPADHRWG